MEKTGDSDMFTLAGVDFIPVLVHAEPSLRVLGPQNCSVATRMLHPHPPRAQLSILLSLFWTGKH